MARNPAHSKTGPKPPREKKQGIVPTDDVIALYAYLLLGQQAAVKAEQQKLSALSKEAAQHGVGWPAIKDALKEYDKTAEVRRAKAEEASRIYAAVGIPAQMELFEAYEPRVNDDEAAAERKGRFAAVQHGEAKPPYPAGSAEGQAWMNGWHAVHRLVSSYNTRMENKAPSDSSAAPEAWDEKPVESVDKLAGVNHDDAPPETAPAPAE